MTVRSPTADRHGRARADRPLRLGGETVLLPRSLGRRYALRFGEAPAGGFSPLTSSTILPR